MYFIKNHDMNVTGCSKIEKNGQGIVWGVLHVLIYRCEKNQKITAYSCLCPVTVTWWQTIKYFGNFFQGGSFPFPLFWRPEKNTEAGQVCVYAHFVWLAILIPSLRGWTNIKAFQIFVLSFEVTVKEIWEQSWGLVSLPDTTLLTAYPCA